jgi:hypothetical protein
VSANDLEWRCPPECAEPVPPQRFDNAGLPRLVLTSHEQSYPCPTPRCRVIRIWPFVLGCDRPFPLLPFDRTGNDHHVAILAIDNEHAAIASALAAIIRSWAFSERDNVSLVPQNARSRRVWQAVRGSATGIAAADFDEPIGIENLETSDRIFIRVVQLGPNERPDQVFLAAACQRPSRAWSDTLQSMDTNCLAASSNSLLGVESRILAEARIEQVSRLLMDAWRNQSRAPVMLILVTDEQRLAAQLGVPALFGTAKPAREIVDGYVLDGFRLREVLERQVPRGWIQEHVRTDLCRTWPVDEDDRSALRYWPLESP